MKSVFLFPALLSAVLIAGCSSKDEPATEKDAAAETVQMTIKAEDKGLYDQLTAFFKPLPVPEQTDPQLVELGRMLYHDTRLSKSNAISCNSCHNLASYGVDNNPVSVGHGWKTGARNSPTVLNASLHFVQFWDGRAKDVEEQAAGPMTNPIEMGAPDHDFVVNRIATIQEYVDRFAKAFPEEEKPVNITNATKAIGAFERQLLTPSRFDRFLQGDGEALTADEKAGAKVFLESGCTTCHLGVAMGGNMYQKFGLAKGPYWEYTQSKGRDEGRFEVTRNEADKYMFKVPGLRNITRTYPYFHDGSVWSLDEAVRIMALTQLNKELTPEQTSQIVAFLGSLEGEVPEMALQLPQLPASSSSTSKPDLR